MQLRVPHWPGTNLEAVLGVSLFGSSGATGALEQPYDFAGTQVRGGLGRVFELGRGVELEPLLQVGYLWLSRQFRQSRCTSR